MNKINLIFTRIASVLILSAPALITFGAAEIKNFNDLVNKVIISGVLKPLVPLLIGLAVVIFIYGVITSMLSEGDKKEEGKQYMLWGIVGIFVMVSVWGLVSILIGTFNLDNGVPTIKLTVPGQ